MKKILMLATVLFISLQLNAQTIQLNNKTNCDAYVRVSYENGSCAHIEKTVFFMLPANSTQTIDYTCGCWIHPVSAGGTFISVMCADVDGIACSPATGAYLEVGDMVNCNVYPPTGSLSAMSSCAACSLIGNQLYFTSLGGGSAQFDVY